MGIMDKKDVMFVTIQMLSDAKQRRKLLECRLPALPPLTQAQFHILFFEKYVPRAPFNCKKDKLMALEQDNMSVMDYQTKFNALYHYTNKLLGIKQNMI